jgi:hypothetical protein
VAHKVFSIVDFKAGLDVRKTPLTAPGGSLRILENAVLNQGGEIEKRQAFVQVGQINLPAPGDQPTYMIGHGGALQIFGPTGGTATVVPDGAGLIVPVNFIYHDLQNPLPLPVPVYAFEYLDVEPYDQLYYVCQHGQDNNTYCTFDDTLVHEVDGSFSRGSYARTWKNKMYRIDSNYLRFSGVNSPAQNDPNSVTNPGAGFINLALNDPEGEQQLAMEVYYNDMAIFARLQTQIWTLDPDPTKDTLKQLLRIGTLAPRSILQFGTGDVLFLSDSGVRSLKAQALNNAASVSDVGSAIDLILIPIIRSDPENAQRAEAIVQPIQGRYWLSIADTIYVLSYFPAGHITAWSTFKPGFSVKCFALVGNMVFALGTNNKIYLYGGITRNEYDSCKVVVRTPTCPPTARPRTRRSSRST